MSDKVSKSLLQLETKRFIQNNYLFYVSAGFTLACSAFTILAGIIINNSSFAGFFFPPCTVVGCMLFYRMAKMGVVPKLCAPSPPKNRIDEIELRFNKRVFFPLAILVFISPIPLGIFSAYLESIGKTFGIITVNVMGMIYIGVGLVLLGLSLTFEPALLKGTKILTRASIVHHRMVYIFIFLLIVLFVYGVIGLDSMLNFPL